MCRHIAYIGNKALISDVLVEKDHSLIDMAFKPKEMEDAILNADGFGIGWYKKKNFFLYKSKLPIWNDPNLKSISRNIESTLIVGNVRSATLENGNSYYNSHPFKWKNFLFSHNGFIKIFSGSIKEKIINLLDNRYLSEMNGNTDSEYIFFLLIQIFEKEKNLTKTIKALVHLLSDLCEASMLNFIVAQFKDNNSLSLYATRAAINLNSPSLYYSIKSNNHLYVSSEKLDKNSWSRVDDFSLLEYTNNQLFIKSLK